MALSPLLERGITVPQNGEMHHLNEVHSSLEYQAQGIYALRARFGRSHRIIPASEVDKRFPEAGLGHIVRPDAVLIKDGKVVGMAEIQYGRNSFKRKLNGLDKEFLEAARNNPELLSDEGKIPQIPLRGEEEQITVYFITRLSEGDFRRSIAALTDLPPFPIERIPLEYSPMAA